MENNLVVKSNNIIEARYKLDSLEQKIILYAVSKLDTDKDKFNMIQIEIKEFTELIDTTVKRYSEFRDIAEGLMDRKVVLSDRPDLSMRWLASCEYVGNGIIELEFSEKLLPYLLQLKERFTRYKLSNILYLKNKYSIRIFELLKQYEKIGKREFKLKELKQILGCEDKYIDFKNFNRFVLAITKKEINKHTDLNIDYEKITKGRKVVGIRYIIDNEDIRYIEYLRENYNIEDVKIKTGLEHENWNAHQIIELYEIATAKAEGVDIFEYIRINYDSMIKINKARNKFSYLKKALCDDYAKAHIQLKSGYLLDLER